MPLVRTDRAAIFTGALIIGLFQLLAVRTGLVVAAQDRTSLDAWVMLSLSAGAMYGILFAFGHHILRSRGARSRWAYAGLGALAATPPFALAIGWVAIVAARDSGTVSQLLIVPLAAGALVGFLYHRRASYDVDGDETAALDHAGPTDRATELLTTGDTEYFGGPLVVHTSLGAIAIAAIVGSAVLMLAITFNAVNDPTGSPLTQFMAMNGPGKSVLQAIIGGAIPIGLLLAMAHGIVRATGRSSYKAYAVAGAIGPAIFSMMIAMTGMGFFALLYLAQFLAPSLVAMLAYRRLAGLEPAPLPDDIEVRDRRTLVGADHVRRRVARVIDVSGS